MKVLIFQNFTPSCICSPSNMEKKIKINKNGNCRFCQEKDDKEDMVACDDCDRWFHLSCVDLFEKPGKKDPEYVANATKLNYK